MNEEPAVAAIKPIKRARSEKARKASLSNLEKARKARKNKRQRKASSKIHTPNPSANQVPFTPQKPLAPVDTMPKAPPHPELPDELKDQALPKKALIFKDEQAGSRVPAQLKADQLVQTGPPDTEHLHLLRNLVDEVKNVRFALDAQKPKMPKYDHMAPEKLHFPSRGSVPRNLQTSHTSGKFGRRQIQRNVGFSAAPVSF